MIARFIYFRFCSEHNRFATRTLITLKHFIYKETVTASHENWFDSQIDWNGAQNHKTTPRLRIMVFRLGQSGTKESGKRRRERKRERMKERERVRTFSRENRESNIIDFYEL